MEDTTKAIRLNSEVYNRLEKLKKSYESWSCFMDRMIPVEEEK